MQRLIFASLLLLASAGFAAPNRASAQDATTPPTNIEAYQRMALECLSTLPNDFQTFTLDAASSLPFVRSALIARWTDAGRSVYLADTTLALPADISHLRYSIPSARVSYARLRRRSMQRTVQLAIHKTLTDARGAILKDDTCERQWVDSLRIADLNRIESSTYPETQAAPPEPGWSRRILEPLVLTAAAMISVYLFFTLRTDKASTDT